MQYKSELFLTDPSLTMDNFDFQVDIKYTRRKGSIGFRITDKGVCVLAPQRTSTSVIRGIVKQRQQWIEQKLSQLRAQAPATSSMPLVSGKELYFLGNLYPLSIVDSPKRCVELDSGHLCVDIPEGEFSPQLNTVIEDWYQQQAEPYFLERLEHWSAITQLHPSSLKVQTYKSRWGSCDHRQRITLNNRLIMTDQAIIDYVIIHELCHMLEMNHSPVFWSHVAKYCPDYKARRRWLRQNGPTLKLG